jgi:hypothetical protein
MPTPLNKTLQIFKPGRQKASSGEDLSFTEADLRATVAAYDPQLHEAPLVVGHPKTDAPAYGWVKSLSFTGGSLEASPHQVDPEFAAMVNRGAFKNMSVRFYRPDSPRNPVPGVWYVQHIGFLGAVPPAVKGLRQAEFADSAEDGVTFGEADTPILASLFRNLRDRWIAKFGLTEADEVLPGYLVTALEDQAAQPTPEECPPGPAYTEEDPPAMTVTPEQLAHAAELKTREDALKVREAKLRRADDAQFMEGLIKEGKALPVHKDFLVEFMGQLTDDDTIEFGEATARVKTTERTAFRKYLAEQPKAVEFREVGASDEAEAPATEFAAPAGYQVNQEKLQLHGKATAYQAAHPNVDFMTAYKAVGGR